MNKEKFNEEQKITIDQYNCISAIIKSLEAIESLEGTIKIHKTAIDENYKKLEALRSTYVDFVKDLRSKQDENEMVEAREI